MHKQIGHELTAREQQVLDLLWKGYVLKEIAVKLGLTHGRVRQIRLTLGHKLNVHNTWQLARRALELGLINF